MRRIAVMDHYMTPVQKETITKKAEELGFSVDFFPSAEAVVPVIDSYEIFFGNDAVPVLKVAKHLKWFACAFAGIDPYVEDSVWANPDCLFTNSAGAYGVTIAEHTLMVLLMLLRKMPQCQKRMAEKIWQRDTHIRSIYDLKVTILGMGDIGTQIARRLHALGATVTGVRRDPTKPCDEAFRRVVGNLDEVLGETDALILCVPATGETKGILSRERLAMLPEGSYVVNVGRGSAIDQEALVEVLNKGHLAGAALDVMVPEPLPIDHPMWETENLLLTPHCSGDLALAYTKEKVIAMFLENLERYAKGEPLKYVPDRRKGY